MSGGGFSITIQPLKKRTYMSPFQLQRWIWEKIYDQMYTVVNRKAGRDVFRYYLRDEASDGLAGNWARSESTLSFSFMDAAGCCVMSSEVSEHWSAICYKALFPKLAPITRDFDWVISDLSRSLEEMISTTYYPIIELNTRLFCIAPPDPADADSKLELFSDSDRLTLEDLSAAQKKKVLAAAESKQCLCQICQFYRKSK